MSATLPHRILHLDQWDRDPDAYDCALLDLCVGPTIDVGCGPGRLAADLAGRGQVVLGIDVLGRAVGTAVRRGASALCRDVFDTLPGEGRWGTVLLADGNIGIGGDPVALLRRLRDLLAPGGRLVTELAAPGAPTGSGWATIRVGPETTERFRWSVVGVDQIDGLASRARFGPVDLHRFGDRWCAVLGVAA